MSEQEIINFLKENGPSTPAQFAKHIGTTLLFASAMLGEVSSKGTVKISNLKIGGGSPLYYLKEHAEKLQNYSENLSSKDKEAYELIKQKKILRDNALTPIQRISLRQIKDFAIPINIIRNNEKELFWKWYLINDDEAKSIIREIYLEAEPIEKKDKSQDESLKEQVKTKIPEQEETKPAKILERESKQTEDKKEEQKHDKLNKAKDVIQTSKPEKNDLRKLNEFTEKADLNTEFIDSYNGSFAKKISDYFEKNKIIILKYAQAKRNKEYNFIIQVPSAVGNAKFFCKAVDKKKITEGELAMSLVEGQNKQMPVLFLTTGDLSKKTEEAKDTLFKDINYIKL